MSTNPSTEETTISTRTMDKSPVVVFQALSRTQQLAANVSSVLKQQDGFQSAFFGVKMEDPETGVLCTGERLSTYLPRQIVSVFALTTIILQDTNQEPLPLTEWSSREAARCYCSSELVVSSSAELDVKETLGFVFDASQQRQTWRSALRAPCTEVFTAFGAEEGFAENVARFVAAVGDERPEGFEGASWFGEDVDLVEVDGDGEKVVRMVIGWASREAHLEAKARPGGEFCLID